ncbi:unnamed protein product [Meganyctiphanes norvegica]|uniref:Fibrinogen C-terminal domain-containing protein n=1 Tax=Meganyctiphanes norvegica TaxID=48144 RepID=A0AAV2PWK7_MEGNR
MDGGESPDHYHSEDAPPVNENLLAEMSLVIEELRLVAESMKAARQEHSHLELAVAQISTQVRDINDHNVHIKKKVRKMSKALNRSTHHHKVKDSIKLLQRDHQRILHAMGKPLGNLTHHHHNHSMNHSHNLTHNHTGKGLDHVSKAIHGLKNDHFLHPNHHKNNNRSHKHDDDYDVNVTKEIKKKQEAVTATTVPTITPTVKGKHEKIGKDKGTASLDELEVPGNHKNEDLKSNRIPDLVVDPPEVLVEDKAPPLPQDCLEVIQRGNYTSGVYAIQPKGMQPFKVWCDMATNGGGWTIIIARKPPQTEPLSFNRNWDEYKKGFGKPTGEQWIGLEALHQMTQGRKCDLRVNITDFNGDFVWSEWKEFSVSAESESYSLRVARFTSASSAGDALKWHNNMKFSTPDRDNDALLGGHCASKNSAGWWYRGHRGCFQAHPTGRYQKEPENTNGQSKGPNSPPILVWQNWRGNSYFPKELYLMFRPGVN